MKSTTPKQNHPVTNQSWYEEAKGSADRVPIFCNSQTGAVLELWTLPPGQSILFAKPQMLFVISGRIRTLAGVIEAGKGRSIPDSLLGSYAFAEERSSVFSYTVPVAVLEPDVRGTELTAQVVESQQSQVS